MVRKPYCRYLRYPATLQGLGTYRSLAFRGLSFRSSPLLLILLPHPPTHATLPLPTEYSLSTDGMYVLSLKEHPLWACFFLSHSHTSDGVRRDQDASRLASALGCDVELLLPDPLLPLGGLPARLPGSLPARSLFCDLIFCDSSSLLVCRRNRLTRSQFEALL